MCFIKCVYNFHVSAIAREYIENDGGCWVNELLMDEGDSFANSQPACVLLQIDVTKTTSAK